MSSIICFLFPVLRVWFYSSNLLHSQDTVRSINSKLYCGWWAVNINLNSGKHIICTLIKRPTQLFQLYHIMSFFANCIISYSPSIPNCKSRYIVKTMDVEKPNRLIIWNRGSRILTTIKYPSSC